MNTTKIGVEYELLIKKVLEKILEDQGMNRISIEHNVKLKKNSGTGTNQFDLVLTGELAGMPIRYLVECKNYSKKINQQIVDGFKSKLDNTSGVRSPGIIVTTKGFQSGALENLKTYGIIPLIVRKPTEEDKDDLMWDLTIITKIYSPNPHIELGISEDESRNLIRDNFKLDPSLNITIIDYEKDKEFSLKDLVQETYDSKDKNKEWNFSNASITLPKYRINFQSLKIHFDPFQMIREIHGDDNIDYVFKVIEFGNSKYFIRKDGSLIKSEN